MTLFSLFIAHTVSLQRIKLHFAWGVAEAKCILVTAVCVPVCLSVPRRIPTLLHGPGCNLGEWQGLPSSCALLGGVAIGARVSLLWQHSAEREMSASACIRYMPGSKCDVFLCSVMDMSLASHHLTECNSRYASCLRRSDITHRKLQYHQPYYYFARGSGCEVLWWVCLFVCLSWVCLSVREDISGTTLAKFLCMLFVSWLVLLRHVYDRPHRVSPGRGFLPHWNCIIDRERGMAVHSTGEVCYLRLPCYILLW